MISIPGSVGKAEALFDYIISLDLDAKPTVQSTCKKRQLDHDNNDSRSELNGHIQFPVSVPGIDMPTLNELLNSLSKFDHEELDIKWNYDAVFDTVIASMHVFPQGGKHCVISNDCMITGSKFNENETEKIEDTAQLFVAIVYAARQSLLTVYNIKLTPSIDGRSLNLQVYLNLDLGKAKENNALRLISTLSRILHVKNIDPNEPRTKKNKQKATSYFNSFTPPNSSNTTASLTANSPQILNNDILSSDTTTPSYQSFTIPPIPTDISLESFFINLHPPISNEYLKQYISSLMTVTLTPFQTQNVEWMVKREGHSATNTGKIIQLPIQDRPLPLLHAGSHTDESRGLYLNIFTDMKTTNRAIIEDLTNRSLKGGILADEMGLGKTVSVLGLISKHQLNMRDSSHPDPTKFPKLIVSKATLIIAPGAIMSQWASEAKRHTPNLKVYEYKGASKDPITAETLAKYDIVLVYYENFKSEIAHSKPPPARSRRHAAKYQFNVSPLVSILWFRCVLDEAQMVESVTSKVTAMANRIPRWYSWAVTGTPMKNDFDELYGLYNYLQLDLAVSNKSSNFKKFHSDLEYKGLFFEFTKATMRRNMKSSLTTQVVIPRQTRHVVHIPFSTIEQHYYEDLWRRCKYNLRLDWMDSIGWELPANASEINKVMFRDTKMKMRLWLLALRQNCIHPSVIVNPSLRLGNQTSFTSNSKKIQSLTDVLNDMARGARNTYDNNQYAYYSTKLKHGGMYEVLQDWKNAAAIYLTYIPEVKVLVHFHAEQVQKIQDNNKTSLTNDTSAKEEEEEKDAASAASNVYHRWNILLHQYYFYLAGVCHQLNLQEDEGMYYSQASDIRRLLLEKHITKVEITLQELKRTGLRVTPTSEYYVGARSFDEDLLKFKVYTDEEIENKDAEGEEEYGDKKERDRDINMLKNLKEIGVILDKQYEKMLYLRKQTIELLTKPLIDNSAASEDATGDEYEDSLSEQATCQVYIAAYQGILQDRKFIIKGSLITATESVESNSNDEFVSDKSKQIEVMENNFRKSLKSPGFVIECIKDLDFFLKTLKNSMRKNESDQECRVLTDNHQWLKLKIPAQYKLIDDLDLDIKKLTQLFNNRIAFYKSLQTISDTLLDWKHDDPNAEIKRLSSHESKLQENIANNKSRDSYFKALAEEQKILNRTGEKVRKDCLICQEPVEKGMITYCGHTSCIDCGLIWFKQNRRCHTCNSTVKPNEWYNVSYKEMEMHDKDARSSASIGSNSNSNVASSSTEDISEGNRGQLNELIQRINTQTIIPGQGAKLDSIIRHIKFIKNDTNGKCVVFSQWSKVLDMLRTGLNENGIKCITLSSGANKSTVTKFQDDATINVILLHARSQSSGLTLVAAQTVFIVEPVFHESLEKQAINRVHRIGQTKETSVFWYIVQDTIEERIQAIHNRKRNINIGNVADIDDELALSKLADGGGEFVDDNDIRLCFTNNRNLLINNI